MLHFQSSCDKSSPKITLDVIRSSQFFVKIESFDLRLVLSTTRIQRKGAICVVDSIRFECHVCCRCPSCSPAGL